MAGNIVYIQANEKIAESFQEAFGERNIELIVAGTAAEALEIMEQKDVGLLLVDINIPDMRLSGLVEICSKRFPAVIMDVCVDVLNSLMITKLVNRHAIHKIFVAPWDVKEMVEEIEESLDVATISRERILHEKALVDESNRFQETLRSLTESLKNQQFSYGKIRKLTDLLFQGIASLEKTDTDGAEDKPEDPALRQMKMIFDTYLRMQTTETLEASRLEDTVRADLEKLQTNIPSFTYKVSIVSLQTASKAKIADIRFTLWLLSYNAAYTKEQCTFSVTNDTSLIFRVLSTGRTTKKIPFLERYLSDLIKITATGVTETVSAEETEYTLDFSE